MTLLVVDSWLVTDGLVRGMYYHEERFRRGCAALIPLAADTIMNFLIDLRERLPDTGMWFPRVEAHCENPPRLNLLLRAAPALTESLTLSSVPESDPRRHPTVKGPDLAMLAALRERAVSAGADDVLLLTSDGIVLEAAHSALVWWRGDTLCIPDPGLAVLPSVTVRLLLELTQAQPERCLIDDLSDAEVWSVNALHGIRTVSGLGSGHINDKRLARYRDLLGAVAAPVQRGAGVT